MTHGEVDPLPDLRLETLTTEELESQDGLCKLMLAMGPPTESGRAFWENRAAKIIVELFVRSLPTGAP